MGVNWKTPGYMIREESQRDKLRVRAGRRAWGFEERVAERKGSELARECWKEIRERIKRRGRLSGEGKSFLRRGGEAEVVEREREEGVLDFSRLEEYDRKEQREERWRRIKNL